MTEKELNNRRLVIGKKTMQNDSLFLSQFLEHLPYYALVLDYKRHIVITNRHFLNYSDQISASDVFGKGPGDIFQCENSKPDGCGNSKNCKFCGIFKTIDECFQKKDVVTNNCNLLVQQDNFIKAFELVARCSPIILDNKDLYLLTLIDVTAEKRKLNLEKIFFHDILNMANGLKGLVQLIDKDKLNIEKAKFFSILKNITKRLTESIIAQRDLIDAEKGELKVEQQLVSTSDIIDAVIHSSHYQNNIENLMIRTCNYKENLKIHTDPTLLVRVLENMLKNAIEAPNTKPEITIGCEQHLNKIRFFIHNYAYFNDELARNIFHPINSDKGASRGLGTYSMRLIGENYLNGRVSFSSHPIDGTTFWIELPLIA